MVISDKLFYEKITIIKYHNASSHGIMVMSYNHFNKHSKKILKLLEDCVINLGVTTYTPDMEGELENEFERLHESQEITRSF